MEVPAVAAEQIAKCGIVHVERECGYLFHFRRNVVKLEEMHGKLVDATNDVRTLIYAARNNGDVIRETVLGWQRRAETVQEEATHLIDEAGHINCWFKRWCCSRFSIGRKAEKKNAEIQALLGEQSAIGSTVADPKPSQSIELVSAGNFDAFASRVHTTQEVIQALNDEKIHLVGVYGMPGVGKTMLIKALAKQVKKDKLFDEVVVVIVSQFPNMEKVQVDIASSLDLKFLPGDTSIIRAARLFERISQGKKVLIVLDDLWERLELADIGIPLKNNDNCCKVVFTTRNRAVCNKMETNLDIEVKLLSEEDSWTLFCKKAVVVGSNISTRIAKEIVNECRRLPLAIVTLALALRKNKNEGIWEDTQLKKSIYEGMEPVISSLQLSFNFLPNKATKLCLLLCCLFPEDYKIPADVLLRYMWGENLFEDVDTVREARARLLSLLYELTSSNLLLESDHNLGRRYNIYGNGRYDTYGWGDSFFVMHDVVRDAAIQIASKDDKLGFKVKAGMRLIHWPDVEWTDCKRMSVMDNNIRCNLPSHIKASYLLTLSLRDNMHLKEIPSDFFSEMGGLLTLDLSRTGISSLPSSISCLVNLRTLLIEGCGLKSISPIQELETLEILSFRHASVSKWPEGICKIKKLKLLDLTGSKWYLKIPLNVIASMHLLEELMMIEFNPSAGTKECPELESLSSMTRLELQFINSGCLYKDIPNWENLARFRLSVFCGVKEHFDFVLIAEKVHRSMSLELPSKSVANWVLVLMAKTEFLQLCRCQGIDSVEELDGKGFTVLKILEISLCKGMKCLVDVNVIKMSPNYAFNSLEELTIRELYSFEAFYRGPIPGGFFSKLKILKVYSCHKLISLVPAELLGRLQNLESLIIWDCDALKEVIQLEEGNEGEMSWNKLSTGFSYFPPSPIFPNLQILEILSVELEYIFPLRVFRDLLQLTRLGISSCKKLKMIFGSDITEGSCSAVTDNLVLPKLKNIKLWKLDELCALSLPGLMLDCPSLEKLSVFECLHLKQLPFDTECVPKLKRLAATPGWFSSLEWDDENTKSLLLKKLVECSGADPDDFNVVLRRDVLMLETRS